MSIIRQALDAVNMYDSLIARLMESIEILWQITHSTSPHVKYVEKHLLEDLDRRVTRAVELRSLSLVQEHELI